MLYSLPRSKDNNYNDVLENNRCTAINLVDLFSLHAYLLTNGAMLFFSPIVPNVRCTSLQYLVAI